MDPALKIALTASIITAVMLAANAFGAQVAGLLAGLPFTTLPTLLVLGLEQGAGAAADAAVGSIVGCALASAFAVAYHLAARRLQAAAALAVALVTVTAGLALAGCAQPAFPLAFGLASLGCIGGLLVIRRPAAAGMAAPLPSASRAALSALLVGVTSAAVTAAVAAMRPSLAGIVAAMPIIGVATVASLHATRGRSAVPPYLRGYMTGSLAKAAFCATFALAVIPQGLTIAVVEACVCGAAVYTVVARYRSRSRPWREATAEPPACFHTMRRVMDDAARPKPQPRARRGTAGLRRCRRAHHRAPASRRPRARR